MALKPMTARHLLLLITLLALSIPLGDQLYRLHAVSRRTTSTTIDLFAVVDNSSRENIDDGSADDEENELITTRTPTNNDDLENDDMRNDHRPWSLPDLPPVRKSSKEFMSELNQLKRNLNISLPWETSSPLPTPIINFNLPKSATLSIKEYFRCGGRISSHTFVPSTSIRIGDCLRDNFLAGAPPFRGCDRIDKTNETIEMYSDIGIQGPTSCFYSSLHHGGLEHIGKYYPNATIVMVLRDASSWYDSVAKWGDGRLLRGWAKKCGFNTFPGGQRMKREHWIDFYNAHTEKVRQFARNNLHMTYVEVDLNEQAPGLLRSYTGISSKCFQHCRPGKPKDPKVDLKTYRKCKPIGS